MTYSVKEIYYTLQGEGTHSGRPAVFCRFAGCNLWSGLEADRAKAICTFCDTDFVGINGINGDKFRSPSALAKAVARQWPGGGNPYVICTGGEPLLQLDTPLIEALHTEGFTIGVETNGTLVAPPDIDWLCVSPKASTKLLQNHGHELKLIYPQPEAQPERFEGLDFEHFLLQPMDSVHRLENTAKALQYCLQHPLWKLSLQIHKVLDIP